MFDVLFWMCLGAFLFWWFIGKKNAHPHKLSTISGSLAAAKSRMRNFAREDCAGCGHIVERHIGDRGTCICPMIATEDHDFVFCQCKGFR